MDAHAFDRGTKVQGDPLLTECDDKDTMDSFSSLLGSTDPNVFSEFDLDLLDSHTDLGHWMQNSLSQFPTNLESEGDASLTENSLLMTVNPDNAVSTQTHTEVQTEMDSPNSAAMRLHANCSNVEDVKIAEQPGQPTQIHLVAMPVAVNSNTVGTNNTPIHSPMKTNTIILDGSGTLSVNGTTYIASPQKIQTVTNGNQKMRNVLTPSQCSPVLLGHLQSGVTSSTQRPITVTVASPLKHTNFVQHHPQTVTSVHHSHYRQDREKVYPKPVFSYSCLIALALKNSKKGNLPVSEIYNFMCENFPYFKTAPDGWKNSVRHNLSLNKCFAKVDNPKLTSSAKKGCLWGLNPAKVKKMEEEIVKWGKKDPALLLNSMAFPENLEAIEKGQAGLPFRRDSDSDEDENVPSPTPSTPVTKEPVSTPQKLVDKTVSTPQKHVDNFVINDYSASPMHSCDIDQEYVNQAIQWGLTDADVDDLDIDLLTNSPLASSPAAMAQGSPLPHITSRSASKHGVSSPYQHHFTFSSPSHTHNAQSPSFVRGNMFGTNFTPPRTLSALN